MIELDSLTCAAASQAVAAGEISARELVEAALANIEARDHRVRAFLEVDAEAALQRAAAIDADARLRSMPLAGVPVALKDNLCLAGRRTTAGSRILEPFVSPYTATAVERLESCGAVCVGKANLDEFAMGSSTENSAFRPTLNPWDPTRVPGGSSGGPAAAVASGQVLAALGSDTGGSIRQPASFCGVVGLKPTYGRVSRSGLVAFASSLDQIGPLCRTVRDAALLLAAIAGFDRADSTTVAEPVPRFADRLEAEPESFTLGVPAEWLETDGLAAAVKEQVEATLSELEAAGASLRPIELPHQRYAVATYYVVATAEASANLARYDGVRYGFRADAELLDEMYTGTRSRGFGDEVKRRVLLGTFVLSTGYYDAYYGRAQRVRTLLRRDFERAFGQVDAIVGPTSPTTAFGLGEKLEDPLSMYLSDIFTVPANLAGLPAISLPCGSDPDGLPVGFQIVAPPFAEERLLQVASLVEQIRGAWPTATSAASPEPGPEEA